jgi:hypothetical protein
MFFFWILTPCRLAGGQQRFEKNTLSIFRAEVVMLGSGGIYIGSEEGKARGKGPPSGMYQ